MTRRRLFPRTFDIPSTRWRDGFTIRPLCMEDVVRDFTCYMTCVDYLRTGGFIQPPDMPFVDFPRHDMSLRSALVLLGVAEHEMWLGRRVEYGLFNVAETEEYGCIYILPSMTRGFDAQVTFWVREDRHADLDADLYGFLREWVPAVYPMLPRILFPGREMGWDQWARLEDA